MIVCKTPQLYDQWLCPGLLHPELVAAIQDFDRWALNELLPKTVITDLVRPPGDKFSWHFCRTAADLRTHDYDPKQLAAALEWWAAKFPKGTHEVLHHDAGSGLHLHVSVRDLAWRSGVKP